MSIFEKNRIIRIKRQSQSARLMQWLLILPFTFGALTELLRFPKAVMYACDVIWLCLLVLLLLQTGVARREYGVISTWIVLFLIYSAAVCVINYQSILYYAWGLRNNFRFYVAFLAFAYFLKEEQIQRFLQLFGKLYWYNFVITLIQFYFIGISGDHLGGFFGTSTGCNGYTAIFLAIVVTQSVVCYLEKKEKLWQCLVKCVSALYIAVLAEIKFFFVAFLLITIMAVLLTDFSWRKLGLILLSAIGISVGTFFLAQLFGGGEKWFTLERMMDIVASDKGYTSSGDLNRLNAIPQINELWLKEWPQRIFGMGLGNCDTASFEIVNTPFFRQYGDMHYTWISYAMMYLETGYIGLMFYWGFFALVYFVVHRIEKNVDGIGKTYCRIAKIMAVLCIIISIYNSSLRAEGAYMIYFVLALPFAYNQNVVRSGR